MGTHNHFVKKKEIKLTKDDVADLILYLIIGTVGGARLFFVLYNIPYFVQHPLEIVAVWQGGLIFLGGFIGSIIAVLVYCKKKKIRFFQLADMVVVPLPLALALGRIGNFINGELVGRVTNVPWAVKFPDYEGFRHPVQLYNSIDLFLLFGFMWYIKDKKLREGTLFWTFLILYSALRFLDGFFKEADQYGFIFGLTIEQITFIVTFIIALAFLIKRK